MKQSTRATLNRAEKKAVRGCNNWGFFAEFLWVLNHLEWCIRTNQTPIVYWDNRFAYSRGQEYVPGKTNFWEFFFQLVSPLRYQSGDLICLQVFYHDKFSSICDYQQNISNLYLLPSEGFDCIQLSDNNYPSGKPYPIGDTKRHPYDKSFRKYVKKIS